jgi:hypothetical protein
MMFGARVRFGVTFKANQPGFTIYTRKYYHNFKVTVTAKNHDGAKGVNLKSQHKYIIAEGLNAIIYDEATFREVDRFTVPVTEDDNEDEALEILYMVASGNGKDGDDQRIGMSVGRQLIKDMEEVTEIIVYKYNKETEKFEVEKARKNEFTNACI